MRVGIVKLGAIGSSVLIEYVLDELARRKDIETFVISSGSKIKPEIVDEIYKFNVDIVIVCCPDASKYVKPRFKKPTIIVTNRISEEFLRGIGDNVGYIVVEPDAMIGARREFLDPTEMCIFNSDIIKVLAITGVIRLIQFEINRAVKEGKIPRVFVNHDVAMKFAGFKNPYAMAKAMASIFILEKVSEITERACFREKDSERFTLLCASAHEMMRIAGMLADEAREIEKYGDSVLRTPHSGSGEIIEKTRLLELWK